jgi:hypothetical protein
VADEQTLSRINELADEEHALREREATGDLDDDGRMRLSTVEVLLDQAWDLLRQRRARREAGLPVSDAEVRDVGTVEGYQQ